MGSCGTTGGFAKKATRLSTPQIQALNQTEKEAYLNAILGDDDDESDEVSDSDDDWLPNEILPKREALDSDESGPRKYKKFNPRVSMGRLRDFELRVLVIEKLTKR
ncbi:hypothetical protein EAG_08204 [Camponotus floridanus]|uniref:Uncharacterized protein n=1 Tax=Camponotus floridanus TaxID=104421 RepID=E2A139_CAMFO|nr:hypothetical protein EAG_08204 [Camponotus floridanus]